ncbi:hypothetical protein ABZ678_02960 [Streptomyces hirsutus]|uniref:hypothetical protein n=1 Tax=Streptomyces hirsutus TaxID=35620 RepID=UPI00340623D8
MTQTETEQRLAEAERQLSQLRIHVAKLDVLVQTLMRSDAPAAADTDRIARAVGVIRQTHPRPILRLVDDAASVSGEDLNEGLRRVRAERGGSR